MKVVILAGGFGTRLSEETVSIPKPMVEIGDKPILWHIMKIYSKYDFNEFIICLGYKGNFIKEYFSNYFLHNSDFTIDLEHGSYEYHQSNHKEKWKITLVDTGLNTMTGGRIKRIRKFIGNETFMLTYGDGLGDINIKELIKHHNNNNSLATLTSAKPEGRFGALKLEGDKVISFGEKLDAQNSWINAGFFVLNPKIFEYIENDSTVWEKQPLENLAKEGSLSTYFHKGFWMPMDKLYDKLKLEELWKSEKPPWKIWD